MMSLLLKLYHFDSWPVSQCVQWIEQIRELPVKDLPLVLNNYKQLILNTPQKVYTFKLIPNTFNSCHCRLGCVTKDMRSVWGVHLDSISSLLIISVDGESSCGLIASKGSLPRGLVRYTWAHSGRKGLYDTPYIIWWCQLSGTGE